MSRAMAPRLVAGVGLLFVACATGPLEPVAEVEPEIPVVAPPPVVATAPEHVLLVSIAGLSPDVLAPGGPMPQLAALAEAGSTAGVTPVAPAVPAAAHASLLTGRPPAAHRITAEYTLGPRGVQGERPREAVRIRARTLWDAAREAGELTAALGWPTSVGAPVDWLLPDLEPVRLGETWPALLEGAATPALFAAARELGVGRPEVGFPSPARDRVLEGLACELLTGDAPPRLLLLRLSQSLPQLVRFGPASAEAREAFAGVDGALRRLADCLQRAGKLARTAWFVVGDVPHRTVHTRIQANVPLENAGLIVPAPGTPTGILRWDAVVRANGGSAFVYAADTETALLARHALEEAAELSDAFRIVSAGEMIALGADPDAWFGLEAYPGFAFGEGFAERALLLPSARRGAAGSLAPAQGVPHRTAFVAWGAGVRRGRVPDLNQLDVAPTVARLLRLPLPEAEGRARVGVLGAPPVAGGADGAP